MLVFYIRHGDPCYDPDQLTPLGKRQAEAVAKRLALFGVDEIYASSSTRAIQTSVPTCELLHKEATILDFLNENYLITSPLAMAAEGKGRTYWPWAHPTASQLLTSREVREMGDEWYKHPAFEEYHFEDVIQPINRQLDEFFASHGYEHDRDKGLYRVTKRCPEKRIAIFAHEMVGKLFMSHVLDIPFPYYAAHFEMKHSAVSVIRFDDGTSMGESYEYARARLLTLSSDAHLFRDGLPLTHISSQIEDRY